MKEITKYECEICGKRFEDEDECRHHERNHEFAEITNRIQVFDLDLQPLPLDACELDFDDITAIKWADNEAFKIFNNWVYETMGYNPIYNFATQESGAIIRITELCDNQWVDIDNILNFANELKRKILGKD